MAGDIDSKMAEYMKPLFGEYAAAALQQQKTKLGIQEGSGADDYMRLVDEIRTMCSQIAGTAVAEKVYKGLEEIVRGSR